jgi:hypothetical protein
MLRDFEEECKHFTEGGSSLFHRNAYNSLQDYVVATQVITIKILSLPVVAFL